MPKFNVTAEVTLRSDFMPDGWFDLSYESITDFEDESSFSEESLRFNDGVIVFVIEAESEELARETAQGALAYALEFHDHSNWEWEIEDAEITNIEMIEEPMTRGRATQIIREYLAENRSTTLTPEFVSAIEFILALLAERPGLLSGVREA